MLFAVTRLADGVKTSNLRVYMSVVVSCQDEKVYYYYSPHFEAVPDVFTNRRCLVAICGSCSDVLLRLTHVKNVTLHK